MEKITQYIILKRELLIYSKPTLKNKILFRIFNFLENRIY